MKGITVVLYEKSQTGVDPFGDPIYEEAPVEVENVLVAPASTDDITEQLQLYGKHVVYTLGIPKGDTHEWKDRKVHFFGQDFRTFGFPTEGIEGLIPLCWNKKVQVERYE
ncbi:MAG: hypothetical protein IJY32_03870 [Mogibacterium sp.]|nr:hypothetical protein [Mogibacterium sp.]